MKKQYWAMIIVALLILMCGFFYVAVDSGKTPTPELVDKTPTPPTSELVDKTPTPPIPALVASDPLNDTGITWGGDDYPSGNNSDCTGEEIGAQDCSHGRDTTHNDDSDGHAGFSFTKLGSDGQPLADPNATSWDCVQDNVTGLIWEVKTDNEPKDLHDKDDTYTWYNTDTATNGGANGEENPDNNTCFGWTSGNATTYCNTQAYVNRVNTAGLCGANDWRMPTIKELESLVNYGRTKPTIDTGYFPNAVSALVWSGSPNAGSSDYAWGVVFSSGDSHASVQNSSASNRNSSALNRNGNAVRLVRSGQ